MDKYSSSLL